MKDKDESEKKEDSPLYVESDLPVDRGYAWVIVLGE